jgi:long-chain acyl-CoA synthetase
MPRPDSLGCGPQGEGESDGMLQVQSGGSTGTPKLLLRPAQTWVQSAKVEAQVFGLTAQDRFAVVGSERHSLWGYAHFRAAQLGAPCLGIPTPVLLSMDAAFLSQWEAAAPTVLYGVPELVAMAARRLHRHSQTAASVGFILLGGGPILPTLPMALLLSVFPRASVWSFYGTAETSFVGHGRPEDLYEPFPTVEVEIRGEGDIWVKSPMTISPKEWVKTGDLGRWADGGRFQVLGRAARQLVIRGDKHVVEPLEQALMQRFDLARVALLANSQGQVCCLVAGCSGETWEGGPEPAHGLSLEQVNAACRDHDPGFPGVRRVITLAAKAWPTTPAGKTNFVALQVFLEGRRFLEGANT